MQPCILHYGEHEHLHTIYMLLNETQCMQCIKNWRETQGKSDDIVQAGTTKTCPMCRTSSRFVTPSAFFYPEGHALKTEVIEKYKASMARVKCRYFEKSKPHDRFCPFGKECFYKHENPDGTPYVFEHGATYYMQVSAEPIISAAFNSHSCV